MCGKMSIVTLIAAAGLGGFSTPGVAAEGEQLLRARGLRPLGKFWITEGEQRLRTQLARVDEAPRRYRKAEQHLDEVLEANEKIRQRLVLLRQQIEQLKKTKPKGKAVQLAQFELAAAVWQRRYVPPQRLGETGATRRAAGEWAAARTALVMLLVGIRQHVGRLNQDYRPLRGDPQVAASLTALGTGHRLGPARDYDRELKSVAELERMLSGAALPFYRQGGRLRVSVLVNHRTPATMTLLESGGQTLIPSSLRQAAGIDIPADAPRVVYRAGRRKLEARRVRIAYLLVGSAVLRDVEALVLPPEGEDLGAQLAPSALSGYKVKLDAPRLRIHFEPIDDE